MKVYTILSDSHRFLFDEFFLKSLLEYESDAELIVIDQKQICSTGSYYDNGWKESMEQKIDTYLEAVNTNDEFFIWSDVDIQFYDKFIETCIHELGENDIAFQEGIGQEYCAGFFISKINDTTKQFFEFIKKEYDKYSCDQQAINHNIKLVKATFLSRKFLNISFQHRQWNGQNISLKEKPILFHANYTVGLQHKIMLLDKINDLIRQLSISNSKNNKIKILNAFYGVASDVTDTILNHNGSIQITTDILKSDPCPGQTKYIYFFDENFNIIHKPIRERSSILLHD